MWCFHDRLKKFIFGDKQQICCCPDCTRYDRQRAEVLQVNKSELLEPDLKLHWKATLEASGLSEHRGEVPWLSYVGTNEDLKKLELKAGAVEFPEALKDENPKWLSWVQITATLKKLFDQRRIDAKKVMTVLDDHEHIERAKPFHHVLTMPRTLKNFCTTCQAYYTLDHECGEDKLQVVSDRRKKEQERQKRDALVVLSNPQLAPSQILRKKGGFSDPTKQM